jgi:CubicO group peptidase (beta-lactamase class C family)
MHRCAIRVLCLSAATAVCQVALFAPTANSQPAVAAAEAKSSPIVRDAMKKFVDDGELSGVVTVVGDKNGIVDVQVLGLADLERKTPMRRDTIFRIASMTKPITALAVMQLVEAGKVDVDEPVEKYLPEFKGQLLVESREGGKLVLKKPSRPITVKDLLTHTSGLPQYPAGMVDVYQKRNWTLDETTIAVSQAPLLFEPGSKWAYCNPGIDTLGRIVEVVSGQSYEEYLAAKIFKPLGMKDTTPYPNSEQLERTAMTYGKKDGKLVATPGGVLDFARGAKHPVPAGGLFSTADDLAKLYRCLLNGGSVDGKQIIKPKTLAEMTRNQTGDIKAGFIEGSVWGFGFGLVSESKGATENLSVGSYGHGGAYGTQGWMDPKKGIFTILLIQRTGLAGSDGSAMRKALHDASVKVIAE